MNLSYTLCKKLKDAGFPQKGQSNLWFVHLFEKNGDDGRWVKGDTDTLAKGISLQEGERTLYVPTLSELIEACGDEFQGLARADDGSEFRAFSIKMLGSMIIGKTPEEAVAKLWLKLNQN